MGPELVIVIGLTALGAAAFWLSWSGGPTLYAPPAVPEPAWFPDPRGTGMMRYWDGTVWTQYLRPDDRPAW
jgi:hypothetical protein